MLLNRQFCVIYINRPFYDGVILSLLSYVVAAVIRICNCILCIVIVSGLLCVFSWLAVDIGTVSVDM